MLHLKGIKKIYRTDDFEQAALDGIDLSFNKGEFVSILGPSGSGKTTMLNIIGGLDQYTSGDLVICGTSTKHFKSKDWDAYRNNSVGFVFQSYNLIGHISVLENVEMAMTLSGVSKKERNFKAMKALERVGLKDHIHKHPNQLSGGQKQRVAIARAISNNPEIILADEPTGALDSKTSEEVMALLQEISKDKLVIMVTHNKEIAETYSSRIVNLKDGKIKSDHLLIKPIAQEVTTSTKQKGLRSSISNSIVKVAKRFGSTKQAKQETKAIESKVQYKPVEQVSMMESFEEYKPKRTSMNIGTALKLSFNNLKTKFKRTTIISIAGSIGIIGVALVLFISNGMSSEIDSLEQDQLAGMPIAITEIPVTLNIGAPDINDNEEEASSKTIDYIIPYDTSTGTYTHKNILDDNFLNAVEALDETLYDTIQYQMALNLNVLVENENGTVSLVETTEVSTSNSMFSSNKVFKELPENEDIVEEQYELLSGYMPVNSSDIIVVIEEDYEFDQNILQSMGITLDDTLAYDELIGKQFSVASNDDYYIPFVTEDGTTMYTVNSDLESVYETGEVLTIVGILKPYDNIASNEESSQLNLLTAGIYYTSDLTDLLIEESSESEIVSMQQTVDYDVLTGMSFNDLYTQSDAIKKLGGSNAPTGVSIYPTDYDSKTEIKTYFDDWNEEQSDEYKIEYTDYSEQISGTMTSMIDMIELVLVAFAAISLVVSAIMIGIITYVSVIERTKEIGVLRSLGASKKDIKTVFYAETAIVGFVAGLIGIGLTCILSFPISSLLEDALGIAGIVQISASQSLMLIIISTCLTIFSGLIPAGIAAKKNPVEALRTE